MSDAQDRFTVSFDLDGVLIRNPFLKGVFPRIRAHVRRSERLRHLPPEEADTMISQAIREEWSERMHEGNFVAAYDWDAIYNNVSKAFGGDPVPDVAELVAEFCRTDGMIALLPGAEAALQLLWQAGSRIVSITNGYYAYQWPVLERLGIAQYFDEVITPDKVGYAKPHEAIFRLARSSVHVGDTLLHDIMGANLARIPSVWIDPNLPKEVRELPVDERVSHDSFRTYLRHVFGAVPYLEFHPEATVDTCTPDYVVTDAREAAEVILAEFEDAPAPEK